MINPETVAVPSHHIDGFDPLLFYLVMSTSEAKLYDKNTNTLIIRCVFGHVHVEATNEFVTKHIFIVKKGKADIFTKSNMRVVPTEDTDVTVYGEGSVVFNEPCILRCHNNVVCVLNILTSQKGKDYLVELHDTCSCNHTSGNVTLYGNAHILCTPHSVGTIKAYNESHVDGSGHCLIHAYMFASVKSLGKETIIAHNNTYVDVHNRSHVTLFDLSRCDMRGQGVVHAYNQSTVLLINGTCHASGFATVFRYRAHAARVIKSDFFFGIIHSTPMKATQNMIAYKLALATVLTDDNTIKTVKVVVKLSIKKGTPIRCGGYYKWRAKSAQVLEIFDEKHKPVDFAYSFYDNQFTYHLGDMLTVPEFNVTHDECSSGIHFFITEAEAWSYDF